MRKKLSFLLIFVITLGFMSLTQYHVNEQKVIFENYGLKKGCSIEEGVEAIEETERVELLIKVNCKEFVNDQEYREDFTDVQYQDYRKNKRENAIKHFYQNNLKVFKKMGLTKYLNVYVSKYSPFIEISFDSSYFSSKALEILTHISSMLDIDVIYVNDISKVDVKPNIYNNFAFCGAGMLYYNRTHTASGIKVGLLEGGILDEDHQNFANANVVVRDEFYFFETETDHATMMGSAICGPNAAAQNCTLYSVQLYGSPTGEMEWLLDNDVDIVNMSFGETNPTGNYNSDSAYFDYISYTYGVVFVASAGNEGQGTGNVANPGMGYNIITLGSVNDEETITSFSSVWDNDGAPKPTITCLGSMNVPNFIGTNFGTSFSCAFVTSMIAMMMELNPSLKGNPSKVLAYICASASYVDAHYDMTGSGLEEYVGAGIFRYDNMIASASNSAVKVVTTNTINSVIYSRTVNLTAGDELTASIAWIASTDGTVDGVEFTDYDVLLRGPDGLVLATSYYNTSIVEMIRVLDVPYTGTYTIEVVQRSELVTNSDSIYIYHSVNASDT